MVWWWVLVHSGLPSRMFFKLGVLGPSFFRTGDEMRSKAIHRGKQGTKLVFSPKLVLRGGFIVSFGFALLACALTAAHTLH
jgi:hypothetical protein